MSEEEANDPQEDQEEDQGGDSSSGSSRRRGGRVGGAMKGAASGAAKEGSKAAARGAAQGATKGAMKGARAGAAAGSVVPVVGTAIGGALGAVGGAAIGGLAGGAKEGAKGAARGAAKGAKEGYAKGKQESQEKRATKKLAKSAINKGAKAAGPEAVAAVKAAEFLQKHKNIRRVLVAASLATNPAFIVPLVVFVVVMVVMGDPSAADPNAPKLTITKTGPSTAQNGEELPYQITVVYPEQAVDIVITDKIPDGTDYIDSSPSAKFDPVTRTATWNLKDYQSSPSAILSNVNTTLSLKLRAVKNDLAIYNQAEGVVTPYVVPTGGGVGGPIAAGYVPPVPASNNCGGAYDFSQYPNENPVGNYGDPQCNFSKDNLLKLLQSKETNPEFVDIWFNIIVPKESGYSPNAWAPPVGSQAQLDAGGAWGLYQMGSSRPPGQAPNLSDENTWGKNDLGYRDGQILDRNDLNWELQTNNAYLYWKTRTKCNFYPYWGSYRTSGKPNVNNC